MPQYRLGPFQRVKPQLITEFLYVRSSTRRTAKYALDGTSSQSIFFSNEFVVPSLAIIGDRCYTIEANSNWVTYFDMTFGTGGHFVGIASINGVQSMRATGQDNFLYIDGNGVSTLEHRKYDVSAGLSLSASFDWANWLGSYTRFGVSDTMLMQGFDATGLPSSPVNRIINNSTGAVIVDEPLISGIGTSDFVCGHKEIVCFDNKTNTTFPPAFSFRVYHQTHGFIGALEPNYLDFIIGGSFVNYSVANIAISYDKFVVMTKVRTGPSFFTVYSLTFAPDRSTVTLGPMAAQFNALDSNEYTQAAGSFLMNIQ